MYVSLTTSIQLLYRIQHETGKYTEGEKVKVFVNVLFGVVVIDQI